MDLLISLLVKCNTFNDVYNVTEMLSEKSKGDLFEIITKFMFLYHTDYVNRTKNAWLYNEIPLDVRKAYKLPSKDKGIDLILETNDNKYYAIQCKFRQNPFDKVSWTNLATFAGQAFVGGFENAMYVTNTCSIDNEIAKCSKIGCIYGIFFDSLDSHFFDNIRNYVNGKKSVYIKRKPKDHQVPIISETIKYFEKNTRGYLSVAPGAGKTFMVCEVDKKLQNKLTIVLVPSLYLLSQVYSEFAMEYVDDKSITFLLCGSDADISGDDSKEQEKIPFLTTDKNEIKKQIDGITGKLIIISTYQSCERLVDGLTNKSVDLIIFDEAHKTVNTGCFSFALSDDNIKAKKRLFATATPKVFTKVGDDEDSDEIISMDNEKLYGKCIYVYQIGQAIDENVLVPYEIVLMHINDEQIKKYTNKNVTVKADEIETIKNFHYVATAMMIENMINKKEINHLLTYHSTIKNSKDFSKLLNDVLDETEVYHIDGTMSAFKKSQSIRKFQKDEQCILTSAKVLNEGVNIPQVDSVCFVESRSSATDIVQCVGRALRLCQRKEKAKIIIPISDIDIEERKFNELVKVIKNLGCYDYNIKEIFVGNKKDKMKSLIRIGCYKEKEYNVGIKINLDDLREKIQGIVIGGCYRFIDRYNKAYKFMDENKKRPNKYAKDVYERHLGEWLVSQKQNYLKKIDCMKSEENRKLWEKMVEKFKEYFMDIDEKFESGCDEIINFFENNKKRPSQQSSNVDEKRMANWLDRPCIEYIRKIAHDENEKYYKLCKEIITKYNEYLLDPDEKFESKCRKVIEFFEKNQKRPSEDSSDTNEQIIGRWLNKSRIKCLRKNANDENEKHHTLCKEIINKYNKYLLNHDEKLKAKCDEIEMFFEENGRRPSSCAKDSIEKKLGKYIYVQKKNYIDRSFCMKNDDNRKIWEALVEKYNL